MKKYLFIVLLVFFWSCGEAPSGWDGAIISPDGEIVVDAGGSDNEEEGGDNEEEQPLGLFESKFSDFFNSTFIETMTIGDDNTTPSFLFMNVEELSSCINAERIFEGGNYMIHYKIDYDYSDYYNSLGIEDNFYEVKIESSFQEALVDENNEVITNVETTVRFSGLIEGESSDDTRYKIRFDSDFTKSEVIYIESEGQFIELAGGGSSEGGLELYNVGDCQ